MASSEMIDSLLMPPPPPKRPRQRVLSQENQSEEAVAVSPPDRHQGSTTQKPSMHHIASTDLKQQITTGEVDFKGSVHSEMEPVEDNANVNDVPTAAGSISSMDGVFEYDDDRTPNGDDDQNFEHENNEYAEDVVTSSSEECSMQKRQPFDVPPINTRFSDIIGHGSAKLRIDEMLLPLALPQGLSDALLTGVRALPASILLYGPPGCGKTQLARAIAGEAQAAFLSVAPSDVLSKFVGESEASIRTLFKKAYDRAQAMESQCAVLFFDEIDALGQSRGEAGDSQTTSNTDVCSRRVLAELLIQLTRISNRFRDGIDQDGNDPNHARAKAVQGVCDDTIIPNSISSHERAFDHVNDPLRVRSDTIREDMEDDTIIPSSEDDYSLDDRARVQLIVVAATNRPQDCDPALLRRFATRVFVGLPSKRDRKKIIGRLLSDVEHAITAPQLDQIAAETEGWSGSDLESLTREAAMAPIRECLRSAALLKRKVRKRQQQGGDESAQEKPLKTDADEEARQLLLNGFQHIRPVTLVDFQNAVAFWLGNQETCHTSGPFGQRLQQVHYDSTSSSDEEDG